MDWMGVSCAKKAVHDAVPFLTSTDVMSRGFLWANPFLPYFPSKAFSGYKSTSRQPMLHWIH